MEVRTRVPKREKPINIYIYPRQEQSTSVTDQEPAALDESRLATVGTHTTARRAETPGRSASREPLAALLTLARVGPTRTTRPVGRDPASLRAVQSVRPLALETRPTVTALP